MLQLLGCYRLIVGIAVAATLHPGTVSTGADVSSVFIAILQVFVAGTIRRQIIRIAVVGTTLHSGTGSAGADVLFVCITLP